MRILATADIHSPKYLNRFSTLLNKYRDFLKNINLVLIAGDLMERGNIQGLKNLVLTIRSITSAPIIACPGNEDYEEVIAQARKTIPEVEWLEDSEKEIEIDSKNVKIIGSRGVLDKPTIWQLKNIKNIYEIYRRRLEYLISTIEKLDDNSINILLIHYAPTYRTLQGENVKIWKMLGTDKLEKYIANRKMFIIHGHAHKSNTRLVKIGKSIVLNSSFPEKYCIYVLESCNDSWKIYELSIEGIRDLRFEDKKSILDYV